MSVATAPTRSTLTVVVGAPTIATALPPNAPALVVEADPERARRLKQELPEDTHAQVCVEVLTAEADQPVRWFCFNDPRLNGTTSLEEWRQVFPNLQVLREEERRGRRLQDVLSAWARHNGIGYQPLLNLVVRQGNPMAAIEGLGPLLAELQSVQLELPQTPDQWIETINRLLDRSGFRQSDNNKLWQRDRIATLELSLQNRIRDIAEREEQLSTQAVRLLLAQAKHEELQAAHDQLQAERDALIAERDHLTTSNHDLSAQRDALNVERDALTASRDHLQAAHDQLQAERDALIAERDHLTTSNHDLSAQRDALNVERDAQKERADELEKRLDTINRELDEILQLVDQGMPEAANNGISE